MRGSCPIRDSRTATPGACNLIENGAAYGCAKMQSSFTADVHAKTRL